MSNGIYMGGRSMRGEQGLDIRNLSKEIEAQSKAATTGLGKRKGLGLFGDIIKTGLGIAKFAGKTIAPWMMPAAYGLDFLIEQLAQKNIKAGDPSKIRALETPWTERQAGKYATELEDLVKGSEKTITEGILGQGQEYLMAETLSKGFGGGEKLKLPDWFKNIKMPELNLDWIKNMPQEQLNQFVTSLGEKGKEQLRKLLPGLDDLLGLKKEGGQVPKYYGGGSVQDNNVAPTISEYFNMQGKSLGGNNKQSLAEMLGRK